MKTNRRAEAKYQLHYFYEKIESGRHLIQTGRGGVGLILRQLREERGWTFREAADKIGCDTSSLSKLEKGQKWNEQTAKKAIATYLG